MQKDSRLIAYVIIMQHNSRIRMFGRSHKVGNVQDKIVQTGWPMEYMKDALKDYKNLKKKDLILFPQDCSRKATRNI